MRKQIEYPGVGPTYNNGKYTVYEYDVWPASSVNAGRTRRTHRGAYGTLADAQAAHPDAQWVDGSLAQIEELLRPDPWKQPEPDVPPAWFDPTAAGEQWNED